MSCCRLSRKSFYVVALSLSRSEKIVACPALGMTLTRTALNRNDVYPNDGKIGRNLKGGGVSMVWGPVGVRLMLENFIQSEANLVQLVIYIP